MDIVSISNPSKDRRVPIDSCPELSVRQETKPNDLQAATREEVIKVSE